MSFIITGANSGLGLEAAVQLAKLEDTVHVVITTRSQGKADEAVEKLVAATGRHKEFFSSLIIDMNDKDSCLMAAEAAPAKIQGVILNAGGWGSDTVLPTGVIEEFSMNVYGHAVFLEALLLKNKLSKNSRVVLAGSFAVLGSMAAPRPKVKDVGDIKEWASYMDGSGYKKYDQGVCYGYTKLIGTLYIAKLAREHPEISFYTVSPGACTGTNGHSGAKGCMKSFIPITLKLMQWLGKAHSVQDGAARFVAGVTGNDFPFPSGTFVGSIKGMTGEVGNQAERWDIFANHQAQDAATDALRSFME